MYSFTNNIEFGFANLNLTKIKQADFIGGLITFTV